MGNVVWNPFYLKNLLRLEKSVVFSLTLHMAFRIDDEYYWYCKYLELYKLYFYVAQLY